ncbi:MAG: hypothetical protein AAGC63_15040, partial [Propionicimonas sp.]
MLAFFTLLASSLALAPASFADSQGTTGYGVMITPKGYGDVWLGGFNPPTGGDDVLFCTQSRVFTSAGATPLSAGIMADDPALAWVVGRYKDVPDNQVVAAVAYLVKMRHEEPGTMEGGNVARTLQLISEATPHAVKDLADRFIREGENQKGPYTAPPAVVDTQNKRTGLIKNVGVKTGSDDWYVGAPFTITLNGPAVFDATGTNTLSGVTTGVGQVFGWTATGNGAVTYRMVADSIGRVTLGYYNMAGNRQNGLTYGMRNPSYDPVTVESPDVVWEVVKDFQPIVSSQVRLTRINKGETQTDAFQIGVAAGDEWPQVNGQNIPINGDWTAYGPLDERAATTMTIPAGAPVAATGTVVHNGPGSKDYTWTPPASGVYAFVVEVKKSRQGANAEYVRSDARDAYFASSETFTVRMSPQISTQVVDRHSDDPDYISADRVTVSLPAGDVWLAENGSKLPLRVRVTGYGCYNTPTDPQAGVPAGATVLGTRFMTYTGPGEQTIPAIPRTCSGAVTYVAEIRVEDQSAAMQAVLSGPVRDWFMLVPETTYVRHKIDHSSLAREYNVHIGGRAYDDIDLDGFPADHGQWQGIPGWNPDRATATVTVWRRDKPFDTAEVPADATVLKRVTIPAVNGRHQIGYTEADKIQPYQPGNYVFVTCFDGDDRVAPFCSAANDVREQFYVPGENQPWVDMASTATQNAVAGEGTTSDTVLITGQGAPVDGVLEWLQCLSADPTFADCDQPLLTYSTKVTGSGFYNHPETKTPSIQDFPPGVLTAYLGNAPTLKDANGVVLDRENFGVAAQTTVIRAKVPDWTSKATPTAGPGDTVSDVVKFDGETRSDWTTGWEMCFLDENYQCPEGASFTVGEPVQVDPTSDTLQGPEWKIEIPEGTKPGTDLRLGHQPVLRDALGVELRREAWGTDGQVTLVHYPLPSMTSEATPSALIGETSQDTVTIVGPLGADWRIVWPSCYSNEADGPECRPDATKVVDRPMNADGTVGMVLPELAVGEELVVQSPEHTLTDGGLTPDLGLRFSWQPQLLDPDGVVMVQEATGLPNQ